MTKIDRDKELSCVRALLERILRVMDEGLFVDYQMEKYGRIGYEVLPELEENDLKMEAYKRIKELRKENTELKAHIKREEENEGKEEM